MNELLINSVFFGFAVSLLFYWFAVWLSKKMKSSLANPLLMCCIFIIILLLLLRIDYETFDNGAKYLTYLLTQTTVCLAVPLYKQAQALRKNVIAIFAGIISGCIACAATVLILSRLFALDAQVYYSLLPKSITTAIAMGVSEEIGGVVSITILAVSITGLSGGMLASFIFKICKIEEPVAQGLACGNASHAVGTSRAFEIGELQGAMSSLSIVVAGILTVVIAPIMANFY